MVDDPDALKRIEEKLDRLMAMVEEILTKGTGRKPGRITKELERHGEMLEGIIAQLRKPERGNGEGRGS